MALTDTMTVATANNAEAQRQKRLANLKPFKKGQSGNPRGRPKKDFALADLARKDAERAIRTLVEVINDKKAPPSARVSAASELLDRGFGRAPQHIDMNATVSLSAEFENFIRRLSPGGDAKVIEHEAEDAEVVG